MSDKDDKIKNMVKIGIFPYINCKVWEEVQRYYFEMIKHQKKWLEEINSFSEYLEWLNLKFVDFFSDIDDVKDNPDFNKFIGSYIAEQIILTKDASEQDSQYGLMPDAWFYEPNEHAEKTKMFLKYVR